jgi:hypothetical protein
MPRNTFEQSSDHLGRLARSELLALRGQSAAWGYRAEQAPSVEPTALACLGLLASGDPVAFAADLLSCQRAADWMVSIARDDGSVPPSLDLMTPGWSTSYAMLLWSGLDGYGAARRRASTWLLKLEGQTHPHTMSADPVIGHDSTLVGWPWVEGTHSWLEPTAVAILALCRAGLGDHPRVAAGISLILDRALDEGGWNYGGRAVFGRSLRPQPGPTGLALLALAAGRVHAEAVSSAVAYLHRTLRGIRSAVSLGWGVLGLRSQDACPAEAIDWLSAGHEHCVGRPDAALGLALVLLASSEQALDLLAARPGVASRGEQTSKEARLGRTPSIAADRLTPGPRS